MQVLASEVNIGYEEIVNTQVHKVNGKAVKNLSDLTKQIENCRAEYLRFDLEYNQVNFNSTQKQFLGMCDQGLPTNIRRSACEQDDLREPDVRPNSVLS